MVNRRIKHIKMQIAGLYSVLALVAAIVGLCVFGCKKEEPRDKHSKIVFGSNRDGNWEIYVMNSDGSNQKRLTTNPTRDGSPVWSPDGKKIAFTSDRDRNDIYVMNANGGQQKRLTYHPDLDIDLSWSPDSKKISFVSMHGPTNSDEAKEWYKKQGHVHGNVEIYVVNADGSKLKRLTDNYAYDYSSYWSPNGNKISFTSNRDGNYEIYSMNSDGSKKKRLTNNSARDFGGLWSPDSKKIAFVSDRDGNWEIYVMNADGSEQKRLTNNPDSDFSPFWHPDGKKISFVSRHGPAKRGKDMNYEINVMNADGSERQRLTNIAGIDYLPSWSPDGKRIAFESHRDGNSEIYIMNADGTEQKNITNNPADDCGPSWSPFLPSESVEKK